MTLRAIQAWGLFEIELFGGLLGPIGVGAGKELMGMLAAMVMHGCARAVLLLPPDLRTQFHQQDWPHYNAHWMLPNLAGGSSFLPGRPVLHVVAYSELSNTKASDLLDRINPDFIIGNEIQCLANFGSARTKRFWRYFEDHPDTRFAGWTGTMTSDSPDDYAHFGLLALGNNSPLPHEPKVVKEWAAAIAPNNRAEYFGAGALQALCMPGEDVRKGFRRRLVDTPGVVATDEAAIDIPLFISERRAPPVPKEIKALLTRLRADWLRPDGEQFKEAVAVTACARQLAAGFFMFWRFPHDEPRELKDDWFARRQEWNRELRVKLQQSRPFMDSPKLCENAATRYYAGGCPGCDRKAREDHQRGCKRTEDHPLWASDCWLPWFAIKDAVFHTVGHKWESLFLMEDAAEWATKKPGIVWVEHTEVGNKLAQLTGLPYYAGGDEASEEIIKEDGSRSIICSVRATSRGKNLQHAFYRNLAVSISANAQDIEQWLGRTHRPGQPQPHVEMEMYQNTRELVEAVIKARERAGYIHATMGNPQKLVYGRWQFTPGHPGRSAG